MEVKDGGKVRDGRLELSKELPGYLLPELVTESVFSSQEMKGKPGRPSFLPPKIMVSNIG
jgi:hypothetical protein